MAANVTGISGNNTMLASITSVSTQSTHAPAHLSGGAIGGIVAGTLGGLLVILLIAFNLPLLLRKRPQYPANVPLAQIQLGAPRGEANSNDRINGEDSEPSGAPLDNGSERPNARLRNEAETS